MKTCFRSDCGFTLVEVLVSLTIMAMITAVAFAGLSVAIDSWHRGSQKIDELDRLFALERLIQRQLALADSQLFRGNDRELEFLSTYSLVNGPGDPVWVRYRLDSDKFVYAETPLPQYSPESSSAVATQTLGSFSSIAFRYLSGNSKGQLAWINEWTEGFPSAVQVQIGGDVLTIPLVNRQ